jgi:MFS family permease
VKANVVESRVTWRAWWLVAVMTALYTVSLLDRQILALLVPFIRADLHISDFQMGLLQGVTFAAFYVSFGLAFGWAVDRFSRRWIAFIGVLVWSAATAACGFAQNFTQLMMARFGIGAGEAALNPSAYSLFTDSFPRRRLALVTSVFGTGAHIGGGISYLLGGYLIAAIPAGGLALPGLGLLHPWRLVMLAAAAPALVFVMLIWTVPNPRRRERIAQGVTVRETLAFAASRWRFFGGTFLAFGLMAAAGNGLQAWTPTHLVRHFHMPIALVVSILTPVSIFGGVSGSLLAGFVVDKLFAAGRTNAHLFYYLFAGPVQLIAISIAFTTSSLPVFIASLILFQLASGYAGVPPAALQLVTPNNYRGQISAAYLFSFNLIGTGIGPTLVGAFTTYLFKDDAKVGLAILTNAAVVLPLALLAILSAMTPMRRAVAAAEWAEPEGPALLEAEPL